MILNAFLKALAQSGDPRFRKVLLTGIGLALVLLGAIYVAFLLLIHIFVGPESTLPLIGQVTWLDNILSWGSFVFMLFLSVVLMVPVASAITSMMLDQVAEAVERKHYSHLPGAVSTPVWAGIKDSIVFLGFLILANLVALILYLTFSVAAPVIFWALNGLLLGREYFTLAAARRIGFIEAKKMRRKHAVTIWIAGTLMAIPLSVPLLNLVIPVLGAATFTHIFHNLRARS
ncbi:EI24 domain-containing protein [Epibacterium ulvae]|uniref:EI24 domain-containing protein n=1 Tax=Epibacterium ulvae TaxID=1156985 RepID=UPI0024920130|nr:EI24 domain-containing protein [Epibacterium ulvae]